MWSALGLALAIALPALPVAAQTATEASAEIRLRKLEAEIRALQRQVFPGGDGKFFAPQVQPGNTSVAPTGTPASTPTADLLARMEALEGQIARLTSQSEINTNKITQLESKLAALTPVPVAVPAAASAVGADSDPASSATAATSGNLAAMTGGASATPKPAAAATKPAAAASKPAATKPAAAGGPSAQRLAAVRAVEKPVSDDPGDDAYSYGFRLWEAKFYPEAQQQLKLYLEKHPRHLRISYARNLLGRAYLDEGKPKEAAQWFLENYVANKAGDRAPDSVLYLAEAMNRLKDTKKACVALAQFTDDYPREAAGRLKSQYDATRAGVKCN